MILYRFFHPFPLPSREREIKEGVPIGGLCFSVYDEPCDQPEGLGPLAQFAEIPEGLLHEFRSDAPVKNKTF